MLPYYQIMLGLSVLLTGVFLGKWNRHVSTYLSMIFLMIPITSLGSYAIAASKTVREALLGNVLTYMNGCYLQFFFLLYVASFCKVHMPKWLSFTLFAVGTLIECCALTTEQFHFLYKNAAIACENGVTYLLKDYGPAHAIYYVLIGVYLALELGILIYGMKKKDVSGINIFLLFMIYSLNFAAFAVRKSITVWLDYLPCAYVLSQIILMVMAQRLSLYDISHTAMHSILLEGDIGVISFDTARRYLGCSEAASRFLPELSAFRTDEAIQNNSSLYKILGVFLDEMEQKGELTGEELERNGRCLKVTGGRLYFDKKEVGYQIRLEDNTKEREYIRLLNRYNEQLESEVERKTEHIQKIQDHLVLSMADMVENRDTNTGGHIKRTSDVIRILADEIRKDNKLGLSNTFLKNLIKAAPMHDLGKVAVDDAILRKPGRFTDEEYEIMKSHAEKGAEIVEKILKDINDPDLCKLAVNVAHYHHERFDGSGYPTGISGEQIPIEARIMAIADVYDALVSKRCYKEAFSFEKAYEIIEEGMGTQFDERLNPYFMRCRRKLEEYYRG